AADGEGDAAAIDQRGAGNVAGAAGGEGDRAGADLGGAGSGDRRPGIQREGAAVEAQDGAAAGREGAAAAAAAAQAEGAGQRLDGAAVAEGDLDGGEAAALGLLERALVVEGRGRAAAVDEALAEGLGVEHRPRRVVPRRAV